MMKADRTPFEPLLRTEWFRRLAVAATGAEAPVRVTGLVESSRALVLGLLIERLEQPMLLVTPDDVSMDAYRRDLAGTAAVLGRDPSRVAVLPALDADPYSGIPPHPEVAKDRLVALERLARGGLDVLLAPARALLGWVPSLEELARNVRVLRVGDEAPPDRLVLQALAAGYRRVDVVTAPGEISRRGGIVDVFPPGSEEPFRLEFFGDTVDSIRSFDTEHQRSTHRRSEAVLGPAVENPPTEQAVQRLAAFLETGIRRARDSQIPVRDYREKLEALRVQGYLPGFESLTALTAERPSTVLELARDLIWVVDEPARVREEIRRAFGEMEANYEQSGDRILPGPDRLFVDPERLEADLDAARIELQELLEADAPLPSPDRSVHVPTRTARAYKGAVKDLAGDLRAARAEGRRVICLMRTPGSAQRLGEILGEYRLEAAVRLDPGPIHVEPGGAGGLFVQLGRLGAGVEFREEAFTVLTEREIFGAEKPAAERRSRAGAAFVSDFRDLKVGDRVVHVDHGIARYLGLGRPKGGSLNRDFMILEFAGGDRLFVPVDRLDLVQKYTGAGEAAPRLDRLGGTSWERVKRRVRKSVESVARELLELYARRQAARGHAFGPDTAWQRELEAAFPFTLTPDQERAVREVKEDMESPRPMDRLLVGDVGFGKTEVAVRAAFKAVMDGFQVAVLAPTTVLAAQHFETFRERYKPFPVRVEMVSRFLSPARIREVLERVAQGEVDVLIGTHRLLSKDVRFRRLGLLVVDEEQRFGVAHKERLKRLSVGVDVLAMTATPIPRTLQMSLAGVRDLSVIETPPPGRMAIQTYLMPFRKNVVAQAVRQEIRRGGQVFVVHNRVETLPSLARAVQELVPEARVAVAHGQMRERHLEAVMLRFLRREADVLVTTTIIENGLDIPTANTIIVNRADRFGLAQLYQLRGRVGRSEQRAYAFFLIPPQEHLSGEARRRLRALQEFSELGAGFRLAAADLEIRGAGEFLGTRQHGHIAALGFDLYCQMLERAVQELRGEPVVERAPAALHLGVDIKLPETYVADAGERLALYKRLSAAPDEAAVDRLQAETEDRYGHLPPAGRNLFQMARLRLLAEAVGVQRVDVADGRLQVRFHEAPRVDAGKVMEVLQGRRGSLTPSGVLVLPAPSRASERIDAVRGLLEQVMDRSAA